MEKDKVDIFLSHFGVKGMKWGVRKSLSGKIKPRVTLNYLDRKEQDWVERGQERSYSQVYRKAQFKIRKGVRLLNKDPKYANQDFKKDSPLRKEYYDAYSKMVTDQLNAAVGRTRLTNPFMKVGQSPFRRLELSFEFDVSKEVRPRAFIRRRDTSTGNKEANKAKALVRKFQHSDTIDDEIEVAMEFDENGYILDFSIPETELDHNDSDAEDFLLHWGVKGMKWGIRRKRESSPRTKLKTEGGSEKKEESSKVKLSVRDLSDEELKAAVARLSLEQQYMKLIPKTASEKAVLFMGTLLKDVATQTLKTYLTKEASKQLGLTPTPDKKDPPKEPEQKKKMLHSEVSS